MQQSPFGNTNNGFFMLCEMGNYLTFPEVSPKYDVILDTEQILFGIVNSINYWLSLDCGYLRICSNYIHTLVIY